MLVYIGLSLHVHVYAYKGVYKEVQIDCNEWKGPDLTSISLLTKVRLNPDLHDLFVCV